MLRHFIAAAALALAIVPQAQAQIVTEEAMIESPQPGLKIYVRNKHAADLPPASPDRTLVFVHGATYPASTAFDLPLGGLSWMDYLAQHGFDVYLLDLPGYGRSTRPASMDLPAEGGQPVETTADAVRDYAAVVDWVLARRHIGKLDVMGWSWGTTIAGGFAAEQPGKVNRLVLYAPVWVAQPPVPPGDLAKIGTYRQVTAESALKRWLREVPASKVADLIPPGWFEAWQTATWATDPKAASGTPPALRAPNGVFLDVTRYWNAGTPTYWMQGASCARTHTPPARSQGLLPKLTNTAWKEYVLLGEGTHTIVMEKNRMLLFQAVQHFLEEPAPR